MWSDEVWSGGEVCSGTMVRCVVVVVKWWCSSGEVCRSGVQW